MSVIQSAWKIIMPKGGVESGQQFPSFRRRGSRGDRAFAYAMVDGLSKGTVPIDQAVAAVLRARETQKGKGSTFVGGLVNAAPARYRELVKRALASGVPPRRVVVPPESLRVVRERDDVFPPEKPHLSERGHDHDSSGETGRTRGRLRVGYDEATEYF